MTKNAAARRTIGSFFGAGRRGTGKTIRDLEAASPRIERAADFSSTTS
jgi:hypothetical protein